MAELGMCGFVAHEDIEPDAEWQGEIEKALRTCDALVALLHEDFNLSSWTDQEVGYALGRGVPVFSVRLDISPYGLFGKKQAFNGRGKQVREIARELYEAYIRHPKTEEKMSDAIVRRFCISDSFAEAKAICGLIERLPIWKPQYTDELKEALANNSQISGSWGVPERLGRLLEAKAGASHPPTPKDEDIPF